MPRNPVGEVWHDLKHAADEAGYQIFDLDHPSPRYADVAARLRAAGGPARGAGDGAEYAPGLAAASGATSILEFRLGTSDLAERYDGVVCRDGLSLLPDADVSWLVAALFARASRFVEVTVDALPDPLILADGGRLASWRRDPGWWFALFEACGTRHPAVSWRVAVKTRRHGRYSRDGGHCDTPPTVWVLDDGKPGHTTQSVGLAEALGWPYQIKRLAFTPLAGFGTVLRSRLGATLMGVDGGRSDALAPPWPDIAIATGWRPAPVTRWIGEQSRGHTRTIQLGRKGGRLAEVYDAVIACGYFRLPPHPRRIETTAPLNRVSGDRLEQAAAGAASLFDGMAKPRVRPAVRRLEPAPRARPGPGPAHRR